MKQKIKGLLLLAITLGFPWLTHAQSCPVDTTYLILQIESNDRRTPFEFDGSYIFKSSNGRSSFQIISGTAPFELKIAGGAGFVILRGRSGDGKVLFKYRTTLEENQAMQYLGSDEVTSIQWRASSGIGSGWTSKQDRSIDPAARWMMADLIVRSRTDQ